MPIENLAILEIWVKLGYSKDNIIFMGSKKNKTYELFKADLDEQDEKAVVKVLRSGRLTRGGQVLEFEKEFARYVGARYAIAVSSGTAGLHLAVRAMGWGNGDKIITSPFSFVASSNCLLYEGAKPVYCDIDKTSFNLDFKLAVQIAKKNIKGVLLPHIFGASSSFADFQLFQKKYKIPVIEDACEAIGKPSLNFPIGSFGKIRVYSFFENKVITSGEGGMVVTNSKTLATKIRSMSNQGRIENAKWLKKIKLGYNYRLTEMQAALGLSQLKKVSKKLSQRNELVKIYNRELANVSGVNIPKKIYRSWFVYFIILDEPLMRDYLYKKLKQQGVESSVNYFTPLYYFSHLKKYLNKNEKQLSVSNWVSKRILVLPLNNKLKSSDIMFICRLIKKNIFEWKKF